MMCKATASERALTLRVSLRHSAGPHQRTITILLTHYDTPSYLHFELVTARDQSTRRARG